MTPLFTLAPAPSILVGYRGAGKRREKFRGAPNVKITRENIDSAIAKAKRASATLARQREKTEELVERGVASSVTAMTAFTFGVVNGRFGPTEVVGVPAEVLFAGAAHLAGISGIAPSAMHAAADGATAIFMGQLGYGFGEQMRAKAGAAPLFPRQGAAAGEVFDEADAVAGGR